MRTLLKVVGVLLMLLSPLYGLAASFPDRAVKIVVPFAPAGPTDLIARTLAKYLQNEMGQPFVVENRPGAGGIIGTSFVANAAPDGYTLLFVANSHAIVPSTSSRLNFDPIRDFVAVGSIGIAPYVLVAKPDLGIKTVEDLGRIAKERKNPLFYGTPGSGTANHLAVQMLADHFGLPFQQVGYSGAAPATQALVAGQVDFIINNLASSLPFIKSGQLVAIGLTGEGAEGLLPDVPLIGRTIPGFEALAWYGVVAPDGTPDDVLGKLAQAMSNTVKNPEFRNAVVQLGVEPRLMVRNEFDQFISEEIKKWSALAKRAGVKPE